MLPRPQLLISLKEPTLAEVIFWPGHLVGVGTAVSTGPFVGVGVDVFVPPLS